MEKYIDKAKRLRSPKAVSVQMRPEVYDLLRLESERLQTGTGVLIRGILEDFYDKHCKEVSDDA